MPRLNNEELNKANGMLNAGMPETGVPQQSGRTRKTIKRFRRRCRAIGIVADRPRYVRSRVTTDADDRYIVLLYLHNRCLTAAATGRQYGSSTNCPKSV
jgi:hypothetical protein